MQIKERSWSSSASRYGFNGMEKDDEVKGEGNSLDFGSRIYDTRLGRWLSMDPLQKNYPNFSPYNYCGGNPVLLIDVDGKKFVNPYTLLRKSLTNSLTEKHKDLVSAYGENFENLKRKHFRKSGLARKAWKRNWKTYKSESGAFYNTKSKLNLVTEKEIQVDNALNELSVKYPTVYKYFDQYEMNGKQINIVLFNDLVTAEEYSNLEEYGSTYINPENVNLTGFEPLDQDLEDIRIIDFTGDAIPMELKMLRFGENKPLKSKSSLKVFLHELGHFYAETKFKTQVEKYYKGVDREKSDGHEAGSPSGDMANEFEKQNSDFNPETIKPQ